MQFILNKAQQEYARFGTKELYNSLCEIIVNRINYRNDYYMKILFDEAVEIAKFLSKEHLNYLSLIFFGKHSSSSDIKTITDLVSVYKHLCDVFPVSDNIQNYGPFLIMMKTLILDLGNINDFLAEEYGFEPDPVKKSIPYIMQKIPGDYGLSPLGYIFAIINARIVINDYIPFENWI